MIVTEITTYSLSCCLSGVQRITGSSATVGRLQDVLSVKILSAAALQEMLYNKSARNQSNGVRSLQSVNM